MKRIQILTCLLIVCSFSAFSQTAIQLDSLENIISKLTNKEKIDVINKVAFGHVNTDKDWAKVKVLGTQSLEISKKINYLKGEADALLNLSFSTYNLDTNIQKSTELLLIARDIYEKLNDTLGLAWTNQQIGYNCFFLGKLEEMADYYKRAFKYFYHLKDPMRIEWLNSSTQTYFWGYTKRDGNINFYKEILNDYVAENNTNGIAFMYYKLLNTHLIYKETDSVQHYIKKIINAIPTTIDPYTKGMLLFASGEYYFYYNKPDSAFHYYKLAQKLYEESGNVYVGAMAHYLPGNYYAKQQNFSEAEKCYDKGVAIANSIENKEMVTTILSELGAFNTSISNYGLSLKYYLDLLKIVQLTNDKENIVGAYLQISEIYKVLNEYNKALDYAKKSLQNLPENNTNYIKGMVMRNIGILYYLKSDFNTAIDYFNQSESILKANNIQRSLLITLYYTGLCHLKTKNYDKAFDYFNQTIVLKKSTGVKIQIGGLMSISVYGALARLYLEQGKLDIALHNALISLEEYNEDLVQDKNCMKDDYYTIYEIYKAKNNISKALEFHEKYVQLKEQIDTENNSRKITGLEIAAATEKQEKENELLKKDNLLKENQMKQQRFARNVLLIGIFVISAFSVITFRNYKQKKIANILLQEQQKEIMHKNSELQQQKEEIQAQADNLELANKEILAQKNIIEKNHKHITDSIAYAQRIQSAILPIDNYVTDIFPEHFIIFKPRDIVSGDFYFVKQFKNYTYVAAVDSTGHGVPGAFMSMLGMAILNEIVISKEITSASLALDEMRNQTKNSLQQTGQKGEQREGFDIAFCVIDNSTLELSFAGAYNPLWIAKNNSHEIVSIDADRQPVGIYAKEKPFTEQKVKLNKGDAIYLFSDGYHSQFGGHNYDKIKLKHFRETIEQISNLPMTEQKNKLEDKLTNWKGNADQTDDILVIGIKF